MQESFIVPAAAALANLAVILFLFASRGSSKSFALPSTKHIRHDSAVYARPLLVLYGALFGWNLGVAFMISAPNAELAWFYLFCMRHFLFSMPPAFLWFALRVSGRSNRWLPALAWMFAAGFLVFAAITYWTGSRILIEEIRQYDWGYFPRASTLARTLLGALVLGCLVPAFFALLRPVASRVVVGPGPRWLALLFGIWWLAIMTAFLPLAGVDFFPMGGGFDALLGLMIAIYLRGGRDLRFAWLRTLAGMLASASSGIMIGFLVREFLLPAPAVATGLVGAIMAFVALLVFQRWFVLAAAAPSAPDAALFARLQTEYGLTYQEARICEALHAGQRRSDLVSELGISDGTFRNHLREIYRKTVDLVEGPSEVSRDKLQRLTVFLKKLQES